MGCHTRNTSVNSRTTNQTGGNNQRGNAKDTGAYCLLINIPAPVNVTVGALGPMHFTKGSYVYVGSAMKGLSARIARHKRKQKRLHWHIDYLLAAKGVKITKTVKHPDNIKRECQIASRYLQTAQPVKNFGCSDCACPAHLFKLTCP